MKITFSLSERKTMHLEPSPCRAPATCQSPTHYRPHVNINKALHSGLEQSCPIPKYVEMFFCFLYYCDESDDWTPYKVKKKL